MTRLEDRLREALFAEAAQVEESPDLFERIQGSVADDLKRRRWRRKVATLWAVAAAGLLAGVAAATDVQEGRLIMEWWVLELITTMVLVTIVVVLGPFIKRFGRTYAADVFRSNPGTGKSFIVLIDFAYYLIFSAYVLFTVLFKRPGDWTPMVGAVQLKVEVAKIAGILLLIGVLHGANLFLLPIVGRLLTLNRQLDQQMRERERRQQQEPPSMGM